MNNTALIAVVLVSGAAVQGRSQQAAGRRVTVCLEPADNRVPIGAVPGAKMLASRMFAAIGITVEWREGFERCSASGILVSFPTAAPPGLKPGALASAQPYERTHIRVFFDRIFQNLNGTQRATVLTHVLAHVLVHEITHILQGVTRHSDSGIMKAVWTGSDFESMMWKPLPFTQEDIELIYAGMEGKTVRGEAAPNIRQVADEGVRSADHWPENPPPFFPYNSLFTQ